MGSTDPGSGSYKIGDFTKPPLNPNDQFVTSETPTTMKQLKYILTLVLTWMVFSGLAQQPFTAGNIVVYRVGDGTSALNGNEAKVFLDEYTPGGVLVQSILMPTTGQKLTMSGSFNSGGMLTLSSDGHRLIVPGFNLDLAAAPVAPLLRAVAVVDFNGTVNSVATITDNPNTYPITSAASDNGTNLWVTGGNGVEYITGGSTGLSTKVIDFGTLGYAFGVNVVNGQLYIDQYQSGTDKFGQIGTGLPTTSGQTLTELPGIGGDAIPYQFAFADLDASVAGVDVLYVASQAAINGGIRKYSLVNGSWVFNGSIGAATDRYTGLTVKVSPGVVTIFSTRRGGNSSSVRGGQLVSLADNSGYNGTLTGTPTTIASVATANTMAFRGVALVPQPAPFTAGNIVVYRVGDGTSALNGNETKVFLDEYTPAGVLVQSILMPITGQKLTMSGSFNSGGMLTLSSDGRSLIVPGFNLDLGAAPVAPLLRAVAVVGFNGTVNSVATITDNPNTYPITSAASDNGTNLWVTGGNGVEYITGGSTGTSTKVIDFGTLGYAFGVNVVNGQLYIDQYQSGTDKFGQIGTGLPTTSGQTLTELPGIGGDAIPYQFAFADLDASVAGVDVLYVACQAATNGGIRKYSLVNGSWVFNGSVGAATDRYTGLTVKVSTGVVTLFSTRRGGNSSSVRGGQLVSLADNSGYNGTLTGIPATIASAATANTMAFRGVARVPLGCPSVSGLRVPDIAATQANIFWNAPNGGGSNYEYAVTTSSTPPAYGTATSVAFTNATGLTNGTTYYAHVRTTCGSIGSSEWNTISFVTGCKAPAALLVNITVSSTGMATIKWNKVFGANSYEYAISTSSTPPGAGAGTNDTSLSISNLNSVSQYYVHVRSNCGAGTYSEWTTKAFSTNCFMPALNVSVMPKNAGVTWSKVNNAVKYEYALTNSPARPLSGSITMDTVYTINKTDDGSAYYFHVRSICANGAVSEWSTISFTTLGLQVYPSPVKETLQIRLEGVTNPSGDITVGDAMGRVVYRLKVNTNTASIDTRAWAPGVYLVRYKDGQNQYTVRILKQ
jgi:hypothetical protein